MKIIIIKTPNSRSQCQGAWNLGKGGLSLETLETANYIAHIYGTEDGHEFKEAHPLLDYAVCVKQSNKIMLDCGWGCDKEITAKIKAAVLKENLNWNGVFKIIEL